MIKSYFELGMKSLSMFLVIIGYTMALREIKSDANMSDINSNL